MSTRVTPAAVLAALRSDETLSSQAIDVEVRSDAIVLRGHVQSSRGKLRAHELVAGLPGVVQVVNELEVVPPGQVDDPAIADDVRRRLDENRAIAKRAIVVSVASGEVTLDGSVASERERVLAGDVALEAPGALRVVNQLVIGEPEKLEATAVGSELEHELTHDPRLAGCSLHFASTGDVGVLSGTAATDVQRARAVELVRGYWTGELRNEVKLRG